MNRSRTADRMRVLKSGKIFLGSWGIPCTVRNLSTRGACLEVQTTFGIPSTFEFAMANGPRRICKVAWLDETKLGVVFQNASTSHSSSVSVCEPLSRAGICEARPCSVASVSPDALPDRGPVCCPHVEKSAGARLR